MMKYTLKDYDLVMYEIVSLLEKEGFKLINTEDDGRVNSSLSEKEIINVILQNFNNINIFKELNLIVEKPLKQRYWYDIVIKNSDNSFYCPINIKITNLKKCSPDNLSSKEGLYFALTGIINQKIPNTWDKYFQLLSENIKDNQTDYYFLVIDKTSNKSFFNSLKRLKTLTPNGNNPPFQCKWSENIEIMSRTFNESVAFLLHNLYETVKKRAQILDEFNDSLLITLNSLK